MGLHDDATCYKCGANAWTSCAHRKAVRPRPAHLDEQVESLPEKLRRLGGGGSYGFRTAAQGLNLKTRKRNGR